MYSSLIPVFKLFEEKNNKTFDLYTLFNDISI